MNRNTSDPTLTCSTAPSPHLPTLHNRTRPYHTQSNPQGNSGHTETHDTLRAKILEHLQGALTTTKKLFTLTGKNFTVDDHIPVLAANLYKTITGQHPTPHTARLPDLRGPKVPHRRSQANSGQSRPTTTTPEPISKPRPECKHPQPGKRPRQVLCRRCYKPED